MVSVQLQFVFSLRVKMSVFSYLWAICMSFSVNSVHVFCPFFYLLFPLVFKSSLYMRKIPISLDPSFLHLLCSVTLLSKYHVFLGLEQLPPKTGFQAFTLGLLESILYTALGITFLKCRPHHTSIEWIPIVLRISSSLTGHWRPPNLTVGLQPQLSPLPFLSPIYSLCPFARIAPICAQSSV